MRAKSKRAKEDILMNWGKVGLFAGGVLFGTAGIKILTSRDAKKVYAFTTAAALRAKEAVMTTATNIREARTTFSPTRRRSTRSMLRRTRPRPSRTPRSNSP